MMKPRINMITLGVRDMEKAILFYEKGLGLPRMPFEGGAAFFTLNGSWLSLYPWEALAEDAVVSGHGRVFAGLRWPMWYQARRKSETSSVKRQRPGGSLLSRLRTYFGEATRDTLPTLTGICGKWPGIRISGPGPDRMKHSKYVNTAEGE
jgi:uncharacterized protein